MDNIWILLGNNLYDTKRHFSKKFSEALNRKGIKTRFLDALKEDPVAIASAQKNQLPDLLCSFYWPFQFTKIERLWKQFKIPFWSILTDPPAPLFPYLQRPNLLISCVDHLQCEELKKMLFKKVFFFGHGVEVELTQLPEEQKLYDVVYLGTCYDPQGLEKFWNKYSDLQRKTIELALSIFWENPKATEWEALQRAMSELQANPADLDYASLLYYIGSYIKGTDRLELIRSIKNATVHIFGGACFRPPIAVKGWSSYFPDNSNVIVHPAIPIEEGIEVMRRSKICLNSMPFFKNGTHERLFMGPACGCMMITTDTIWAREHFNEGEDMVFYKPGQWSRVNESVEYYLSHEDERKRMAERAKEKVRKFHTWDSRVDELLQVLPPILNQNF